MRDDYELGDYIKSLIEALEKITIANRKRKWFVYNTYLAPVRSNN